MDNGSWPYLHCMDRSCLHFTQPRHTCSGSASTSYTTINTDLLAIPPPSLQFKMKLHFIPAVLIVALVSAGVVPSNASLERLDSPLSDDISLDWSPEATVHTNTEPTQFEKAAEIGRTLDAAMKSKDSIARWFFKDFPNFSETCQSPFDGDGREELKKWGFEDSEALSKTIEKDCDFDKYHNIKAAFDELGLDTKAEKDGGPNKCIQIDHRNGPAIKRLPDGSLPSEANQYYEVCGREYRVWFRVGTSNMAY